MQQYHTFVAFISPYKVLSPEYPFSLRTPSRFLPLGRKTTYIFAFKPHIVDCLSYSKTQRPDRLHQLILGTNYLSITCRTFQTLFTGGAVISLTVLVAIGAKDWELGFLVKIKRQGPFLSSASQKLSGLCQLSWTDIISHS
jgi:hypothetical protein